MTMALGYGLGYLGRFSPLSNIRLASQGLACGLFMSTVADFVKPGRVGELSAAVADTWHSGAHMETNIEAVRHNAGRLAFDVALLSTAAGFANKVGWTNAGENESWRITNWKASEGPSSLGKFGGLRRAVAAGRSAYANVRQAELFEGRGQLELAQQYRDRLPAGYVKPYASVRGLDY